MADEILRQRGIEPVDEPLPDEVVDALAGIEEWTPVVAGVRGLARREIDRVESNQFLAGMLPSALTALSASMRGEVPDAQGQAGPDSKDRTADALIRLGARAYVAFLSRSDEDRTRREPSWAPPRLAALEGHADALSLLRDELPLAKLTGRSAPLLSTTFGSDSSVLKRFDLAELLLHGAWRLCLFRGAWGPGAFRRAISEQLETIRAATRADALAQVPTFCGFSGATVTKEFLVGDSVVRPYVGNLQDTVFDGADRLGNDAGFARDGFVVERPRPWQFHCDGLGDSQNRGRSTAASDDAEELEDWAQLRQWADCLAIAVTSPQLERRLRPHALNAMVPLKQVPQLVCVYAGDPLDGSRSFHFTRPWPYVQTDRIEIQPSHVERARALAEVNERSFRVALRRVSASLASPRLWEDALLDAVVAWEALAGDCREAVTMMTSAVIARLVAEPRLEAQVRKEIKRIYRDRSHVVHGGEVASPERAKLAANVATRVAIVALNALVDEHPDLIRRNDRFDGLCLEPERSARA